MNAGEEIIATLWEVFNKKNWLDGYQMKAKLKQYHPSDLHCIDYISTHQDCNVTILADAFYMTKSAISKLTKRLMKKGLIESYQKPTNKKEIYYRLSKEGSAVNETHRELHQLLSARDEAVLSMVKEDEFVCIMAFAKRYSAHLDEEIKALDVDMKQEDFDTL